MFEMVILLCTPFMHCQEVRLETMSCQSAGIPALAVLCEERPGYHAARWSCRELQEKDYEEASSSVRD